MTSEPLPHQGKAGRAREGPDSWPPPRVSSPNVRSGCLVCTHNRPRGSEQPFSLQSHGFLFTLCEISLFLVSHGLMSISLSEPSTWHASKAVSSLPATFTSELVLGLIIPSSHCYSLLKSNQWSVPWSWLPTTGTAATLQRSSGKPGKPE